jgi:hypothetical protein
MDRLTRSLFISSTVAIVACSSNSTSNNPDSSAASETPPMGAAKIQPWLASGAYKSWNCEPAVHTARSPSPHGFDRICMNDVLASNATSTAPWPAGAAAVKELYASLSSTTVMGYAVYLKTEANSAGGANWYWYENVPLSSAFPPDSSRSDGVVDGLGTTGDALTVCIACHAAAGSNAAHTPSPNGHDFVYTP